MSSKFACNLYVKTFASLDCCQLLGKELGWRRLLPHRTRRKRMWNRGFCDWCMGPDIHGGHAQPLPSSPRKTQIEMPNHGRLWSLCLILRSVCTSSPDWTNTIDSVRTMAGDCDMVSVKAIKLISNILFSPVLIGEHKKYIYILLVVRTWAVFGLKLAVILKLPFSLGK